MIVEYFTLPQKNEKYSKNYQRQLEEATLGNWEGKTNREYNEIPESVLKQKSKFRV